MEIVEIIRVYKSKTEPIDHSIKLLYYFFFENLPILPTSDDQMALFRRRTKFENNTTNFQKR